jgi:hypothetical protein
LKETNEWIRDLESVRDGLYLDSIHNAILLEYGSMLGLDDPASAGGRISVASSTSDYANKQNVAIQQQQKFAS